MVIYIVNTEAHQQEVSDLGISTDTYSGPSSIFNNEKSVHIMENG